MQPDDPVDRDPPSGPPLPAPLISAERLRELKAMAKSELIAQLAAVETRLGTPQERAPDLAWARALAHQLNNVLTAERLSRDLREIDGGDA